MLPTEILTEGSLRPLSTGPSVAMLFSCEHLGRKIYIYISIIYIYFLPF